MKSKYDKWLSHEMKMWQENGLIDAETATKINSYYLNKERHGSIHLGAILGVLGFILIGLGIVLILAKNWDFFPRGVKVLISLLPFLTGSFAGMIILKRRIEGWILEAISIFTTIGILTAIVMSGQIYHIITDEWLLFLIACLLSLPLIYLYDSLLTLGAYLILASMCLFMSDLTILWVRFGFSIILIGLCVPYAMKHYRKDKLSLITGWNQAFIATSGMVFILSLAETGAVLRELYLIYFILLMGIDKILYQHESFPRVRILSILGHIGFYITLFICTFKEFWYYFYLSEVGWQYEGIIIVFWLAALLTAIWPVLRKCDFDKKDILYLLAAAIVIVFRWTGLLDTDASVIITILFNIIFIILSLMMVREGIVGSNMGHMNIGLLLLTALIIARFFDSEFSFLVKGIVFILCGTIFLLTNLYLIKRRIREADHV